MQRGITGRYETTTTTGESVKAFIPYPLPPNPPLELSPQRQHLLERAHLALGRLDSISLLLPDPKFVCLPLRLVPGTLKLNIQLPGYGPVRQPKWLPVVFPNRL